MRISSAVVLVGGPGERLRPITDTTPKAMVEVHGKPLLEWILEWLLENDVRRIVLGVAYLKEKIIDHFKDGGRYGADITYSHHTAEGGTAEGFRLAISRHMEDETFFALNGDQITDLDLRDLGDFHLRYNPMATIAVTSPPCPYGHVESDENDAITGFKEKPQCPIAVCSTGVYVFNKSILPHLPETGDIEKTTFPNLARLRRLKKYFHDGYFITVNTYRDLAVAEVELKLLLAQQPQSKT